MKIKTLGYGYCRKNMFKRTCYKFFWGTIMAALLFLFLKISACLLSTFS